jgi:hypothetical protein
MAVSDIKIFESNDGGEWSLLNDDIETTTGFAQMVYLALFGGNIEASTVENEVVKLDERLDWFGNKTFDLDFNSTFEALLSATPLNSAGVSLLEQSAIKDLEFMKIFADVEVEGSIIAPQKFQLIVNVIEPNEKSEKVKFIWDGQRKALESNEAVVYLPLNEKIDAPEQLELLINNDLIDRKGNIITESSPLTYNPDGFGYLGQNVEFDGVDQYAQIDNIQIGDYLSIRIRLNESSSYSAGVHGIIGRDTGTANFHRFHLWRTGVNFYEIYIGNGTIGWGNTLIPDSIFEKWKEYYFILDYVNKIGFIYRDNKQIQSINFPSTIAVENPTDKITLAAYQTTAGYHDMKVSNFDIFSRVLTDNEINILQNLKPNQYPYK